MGFGDQFASAYNAVSGVRQRDAAMAENTRQYELDRQRQIDQFERQFALRSQEVDADRAEKSVRMIEHLNTMRDRVAAEAPQYRKDYSEADNAVRTLSAQFDVLKRDLPPEAMEGLLGNLKNAVETRDALKSLAVEREQRLSSIDRALTQMTMTMPSGAKAPSASGTEGQPTFDQPTTDAAPAESAPANAAPAEAAPKEGEAPADAAGPATPPLDPLDLISGFFEKRGFVGGRRQGNSLVFTASHPGEAKAIQEQADNLSKLMFGGQTLPIRVIDRWPELEKAPERFASAQRLENSATGDLNQINSIMTAKDPDAMLRSALSSRPIEDQGPTAKALRLALEAQGAERATILKAAKDASVASVKEAESYTATRKKMLEEYDSIINGGAYTALGTVAPNLAASSSAASPPTNLDRGSYATWYAKNVLAPPPKTDKSAYDNFLKSFNESWMNYSGGR